MTPDEINALPEAARSYVHQLESRADPAGEVIARVVAQENCAVLQILVVEKNEEIAYLRRQLERAKVPAPIDR